MNTKEQLIKHLEENTKVLKTIQIKKAFEKVDRADFVPENLKEEVYEDYPLPIGFGQTISQPTTVAFMLELLGLRPSNRVLDVGSGSGYTTALLASLVPDGEVTGIEIIPELAEIGKNNLAKYNFSNAEIKYGNGKLSTSKNEKYDRILVNAAAKEIPENLVRFLKPEGIMVIPVRQSIFKIYKNQNNEIGLAEYPGFAFVPLQ